MFERFSRKKRKLDKLIKECSKLLSDHAKYYLCAELEMKRNGNNNIAKYLHKQALICEKEAQILRAEIKALDGECKIYTA